jgi:DNA modification methylase
MMPNFKILEGDCRQSLKSLPDESVHCCVTSPPYFGLRDYGCEDQIGLEQTPDAFVEELVAVFREVKRVLRNDGTLCLNLGDSYARQGGRESKQGRHCDGREADPGAMHSTRHASDIGLKPKDLIGIPWMVAFALRADGWYLRQDIIWHKPNPMPESVTDRCTKSHEYIFLLSKSAKYYYDHEAVREPCATADKTSASYRANGKSDSRKKHAIYCPACDGSGDEVDENGDDCHACNGTGLADIGGAKTAVKNEGFWKPPASGRNRRSVWTVATKPYKGAHFATFPPDLILPCILAGCPKGGVVLDPFGGSGTTAQVAMENNRSAILCELNPEYVGLINERLHGITPTLF